MTFVNTVVCALVLSAIFAFVVYVKNCLLGRMTPLKPKDEGNEDPGRAKFYSGRAVWPNAQLWEANREKKCPLHSQAYCGMVIMPIVEPAQAYNILSTTSKLQGCLHIASCPACMKIALPLKTNVFVWSRKNDAEHPAWASTHLSPHLLGRRYAQVASVLEVNPQDETWHEQLDPEMTTAVGDTEGLSSALAILERCTPHLLTKRNLPVEPDVAYVGSQVPRKLLAKVEAVFPSVSAEIPLLHIHNLSDDFLLVTDHTLYASRLGVAPPKLSYRLHDITSVEKVTSVADDGSVSDLVVLDGAQWCYSFIPGRLVDAVVVFVRALVAFARKSQPPCSHATE